MDSNPYEPPVERCADARPEIVGEDTGSSWPSTVTVLLGVFVLYGVLGGLCARIEPEELAATIVLDVLAGFAIIALVALGSRGMSGRRQVLTRFVLAPVIALLCSGMLIGWHCLTLHLRYRAIELHQQWQERQDLDAKTVE